MYSLSFFFSLLIIYINDIKCREDTLSRGSNIEWISLFDGKSPIGWREFNESQISSNWIVENGCLIGKGSGSYLVYGLKEFGEFELIVEWKLSKGGNSGIFYHILEGKNYVSPVQTGPEYQLIDESGL